MRLYRPKSAVRVVIALLACGSMTYVGGAWWTPAAPAVVEPGAALPPPSMAAVMTAALATDTDGDAKADPNDVIRYSTTITNSGPDATGVHFSSAPPSGTTWDGTYHVSPLAVDESYTSVGNMTLTTSSIGADCAANTLHSVTCNDTFNGATLTKFGDTLANAGNVTANGTNTVTTTHGGVVTLHTDGTFVYDPAAGYEGPDGFYYTLTNSSISPNLTDIGHVTLTVGGTSGGVNQMVWFVNSTGPAGNGTQESPFNSLSAFNAVNNGTGTNPASGDTIFLLENATPSTGSVTLLANQRLIGQDALATQSISQLNGPAPLSGNAYPADGANGVTLTSSAAGTPTITLSAGNTLAGFTVGHTNGSFAVSGSAAGSISVFAVTINSTGGGGLNISTSAAIANTAPFTGFTSITSTGGVNGVTLTGVTGTLNLSGSLSGASGATFNVVGGTATITDSGSISQANNAALVSVSATNTGTLTFEGALSASNGPGLQFNDADGTYKFNTVTNSTTLGGGNAGVDIVNGSAGTFTFGRSGTPTSFVITSPTGNAFDMDGTAATNTAALAYNGNITQANNFAAVNVKNHTTGTVTFQSGTLSATNGTGLQFDNADATYNINGTTTLNGGDAGIDITNGSAGTFSFSSGTSINNPTGIGFRQDTSTANVTYAGTISKTNNASNAVSINAKTSGTDTFSGAITGTTTTANAITLTGNTGGTITFTGGLALTTTTGVGFNATGGGTVNATQNNTTIVNTISSTTGTALNVTNTTIGAAGLTFRGIASNGAVSGIVLNSTGTTGGLTVTGNSSGICGGSVTNTSTPGTAATVTAPNTADCTGGIIQNSTGAAISLTTVGTISLTRVEVSNSGTHGITINGATGFTLDHSFVTDNTGLVSHEGVKLVNVSGTVAISNSTSVGGPHNNIDINNFNTNMTALNVMSSVFRDNIGVPTDGLAGDGVLVQIRGTSVLASALVSDSVFKNSSSTGMQVTASDTARIGSSTGGVITSPAASNSLTVQNSTFIGNNAGVDLDTSQVANFAFRVLSSTFQTHHAQAINIFSGAGSDTGPTAHFQIGKVDGNVIGIQGTKDSGSAIGNGVRVIVQGVNTQGNVTVSNNTIHEVPNADLITLFGQNGNAGTSLPTALAQFNVINNSMPQPSGTNQNIGCGAGVPCALNGIFVLADEGFPVCAAITGNTIYDLTTMNGSYGVYLAERAGPPTGAQLTIAGSGSAATYVTNNNTISGTNKVLDEGGNVSTGSCSGAFVSMRRAPNDPVVTVANASKPAHPWRASAFNASIIGFRGAAFHAWAGRLRGGIQSAMTGLSRSEIDHLRYAAMGARQSFARTAAVAQRMVHATGRSMASLFAAARTGLADSIVTPLHAFTASVEVDLGTLPAGKTITVVFAVTVDTPPVASYSTQGTVTWTNSGSVLTDDPSVGGLSDPTVTPGDRYDTTTALVSSLNPSFQGDSITFTATVTPTEGSGFTPDGTIQFKDGLSTLGIPVTCADAGGFTCSAQYTTTTLGTGSRNITADYLGGTNHDPSTSNTVVQVNNACTVNPIVQNNAADGAGSLRQAILDACGSGGSNTITFNMGSVATPIGLTSGELVLTKNVIITGPGANLLTVQRTSGTARVFHLNPDKTATISGLTIAGGNATTGAGILNDHGTLTLVGSTVSGNGTTATTGGGVYNDGSTTPASLTIVNSTVSGNTSLTGGGVYNQASGGGAASATITNSTISGNTATTGGGGLVNAGSAPADAVLTITNGTITDNHADNDDSGAETGGGLLAITTTATTLHNTIVARNYTGSGTTTADDISGTVDATSAFNLIGTGGAGGLTNGTSSNQVGVANPGLGALANNGGATRTHALLQGSPAIDAGDNSVIAAPPFLNVSPITDQRGTSFRRVADGPDADATATADIGALEAQPTIEDISDKATNEDAAPLAVSFNVGDATVGFDSIAATSSLQALVSDANLVVTGSGSTRTLTITPVANASGSATVTVTASKTLGGTLLTATDTFVLTVSPVNDAPTIDVIADPAAIPEDSGQQTVSLSGIGAGGGESQTLTVTAVSSNHALILDPAVTYSSADPTGSLSYTPVANASGTSTITVTVQDNGGILNGGVDTIVRTFTVTVNPIADTPSVTNAATAEDTQTTSGLAVTKSAADGAEVTHVKITNIIHGALFLADGTTPVAPNAFVPFADASAGFRFTPALNYFGAASFDVQASTSGADAGLGGGVVTATITVSPVADTPQVTPASTPAQVQTTSGLVITPNAADGAEVTHFKITGITNGALFQNDGTTAINDGEFIALTDGAAGLKFTPANGFAGAATFQVQGALDNAGAGVSSAATATITVTQHTSTTTVVSANPNPSEQTQPITVVYTVASADGGPTPTGNVTVSISGGSETCTGTVAAGQCILTPTIAGARNILATYAGDTVTAGSASSTLAHTVTACAINPVVTTNADSGAGSLRQALADACIGNTITFSGVVSPIGLTSGELTLAKNVTLSGPGANLLTVQRSTGTFRVFSVSAGRTVTISGLTIANGVATGSPAFGGGIDNNGGTLTVIGGALVGNAADNGGAIANRNNAALTLVGSTLSANSATFGGALYNEEASGNISVAAVTNSTLSGNSAAAFGGAIYSAGTLTLIDSTVTNNRADSDSDLFGNGGGLLAAGAIETLRNTIVAGNYAGGSGTVSDDVAGALDPTSNNNLIGDGTGMTGVSDGINANKVGTAGTPLEAMLGPLQNNGGPTLTHMLLPGSPALDAGDNAVTSSAGLTTDQRGTGFARVLDSADADATQTVDIGAVEADPIVEVLTDKAIDEDGSLQFIFNVGDATSAFDSIAAVSGNTTLLPNLPANVSIGPDTASTRTLTLTPVANLSGTALVTVTATKTVGGVVQTSQTSFTLTVNGVNDPPTLNPIASPAPILEDAAQQTINLSGISAGGGESQTLVVTAASSNTALIPNPAVTYTSPNATGSLAYTPVADTFGTAIVTVTVTDALGAPAVQTFTVTVTPAADTPSITNASTPINTQSTSGLVVSRNAADGAEVTHVQVTNITGGALFQHDGTTPIANGAFITIAEGAAGLRFTPTTDSTATGHFTIQASTSGLPAGLAAGFVTASIVVTCPGMTINPATLAPAVVGVPYTQTFTQTGGVGAVAFSLTGALSTGLTFDAATATISGVPLVPGSYPIAVTATPANGCGAVSASYTLAVGAGRSIMTGADAGGGAHVRRFMALDGSVPSTGALSSFLAFDASFTGGVRVAEGDVNGDGVPDYIAGAGPGGAPEVRVFDGATGALLRAFLAFEAEFRGGVFVAAGDVNGDGLADVIVGSGGGRSGDVKVFSGGDGSLLRDTVVFAAGFTGGVRVAAGDVNGDGFADLVAGTGPGVPAAVTVLSGSDLSVLRSFTPYPGFPGGVWVAAADVTGDGFADVITGAGEGGGPHVRVFDGVTGAETLGFFAFDPAFPGGVRVAAGDVTGDGKADIIAAAGPGGAPMVRVFDGTTAALVSEILAYAPVWAGGVFVATNGPLNRLSVDGPVPGATVAGAFALDGWAFEETSATDEGLDTIHVWAIPIAGGAPQFLGVPTIGLPRPDVAAYFGKPNVAHAGFHLDAPALPAGTYYVVVFVHSRISGTFNFYRFFTLVVAP